ncbi:MAG: tetraacyldisaccharide 4'-kinase [Phycisphaerae bacterium]|nr:tetraacyldisaccharide 4'-kinase [Phycisphaerae bacterium]
MIRPRPKSERWTRLLTPLSGAYAGIMRMRNRRYAGGGGVTRVAVPVISIGNITVGGTGKTPTVIEVVRHLREWGRRPVILTRGYGARTGETADEVLEFHDAVADVPVVVNPDRVAGAAMAQEKYGADCLVLDDGFQHRRLARDLEIVMVDALDPWGGRLVLPAGRLREPLEGLARAHLCVITRTNQVDAACADEIEAELRRHAPQAPVVRSIVAPEQLVHLDGRQAELATLAGLRVQPVCGLGNPGTFGRLLEPLAGCVRTVLAFGDHHRYTRRDADIIAEAARLRGVDLVVTTRKDWGKLARVWPSDAGALPLARVDIRVRIVDEGGHFEAALRRTVSIAAC